MSMLSRLTFATLFFGTLLMGQTVWATTYYVSTTGNDAAIGTTTANPWRTITFGAGQLGCGDTLMIRGGTYTTEGEIRVMRTTCSASTPIILMNYPRESPIVHWTDKTNPNNRVHIYPSSPTVPVTNVIIEGLEFWDGYDAIKLEATTGVIIRNCTIHGSFNIGILATYNKNVTIDRNLLYDNGSINTTACGGNPLCNQQHSMYLAGTGFVVTNNLVYDNLAYGIQLAGKAYVAGSMPDATYAGISGLVANNTVAYQRNRAGIVIWGTDGASWVHNLRVENNICYENSQAVTGSSQCIDYISCCGTGVVVHNNLWFGTGNSVAFSSGTCTNCTISSTILGNPLMVNAPSTMPASPNFRLNAGSPAINVGPNLISLGITTDYTGIPRPASGAWDVGAYIFSNNDSVSPAPPQGLQVK